MDTLNDIISGLKWGNLDPIEAHDRVLLLFNVMPSLPLDEIKLAMDKLTDEERMTIFSNYCKHCGSADLNCQCWNDD